MTQDLTPEAVAKLLRENCSCNIDTAPCGAEDECRNAFIAADLLEALAAERDAFQERLEREMADTDDADRRAIRLAARATAAETKLTHMTTAWSNDALRVGELEAEVARLREVTPTDNQVASACLSYRHDFGLMDKPARDGLMWQAKEWLHAWRKEFATLQPKETDHE
jgi:hypothetical protein